MYFIFFFQASKINARCVHTFFELFHKDSNKSDRILKRIYCHIVDKKFNKDHGYHGRLGNGVAFFFNFIENDKIIREHYCLGLVCGKVSGTGCQLKNYNTFQKA